MSFTRTRQTRRNVQRDDLDTLQFASDPVERMLAGERLIASITADRNRALVAACAEYGRAAVAEALGITRQAVYKRLQGTAVGQMVVTTNNGDDRRSRIRSLLPNGLPPPVAGRQAASPSDESTDVVEHQLVGDGAGPGDPTT